LLAHARRSSNHCGPRQPIPSPPQTASLTVWLLRILSMLRFWTAK
jgi:hypothetical protein